MGLTVVPGYHPTPPEWSPHGPVCLQHFCVQGHVLGIFVPCPPQGHPWLPVSERGGDFPRSRECSVPQSYCVSGSFTTSHNQWPWRGPWAPWTISPSAMVGPIALGSLLLDHYIHCPSNTVVFTLQRSTALPKGLRQSPAFRFQC